MFTKYKSNLYVITMHPFTAERIQQEIEYEAALRADLEREFEIEENSNAESNPTTDLNLVSAEEDESDEDTPLTLNELRARRMKYFCNVVTESANTKPVQCICMTQKNKQCRNRADMREGISGTMCYIHYKLENEKKRKTNLCR